MMKSKNPIVNSYLDTLPDQMEKLFLDVRAIVLDAAPTATEEIKWKNCLTYVVNGKNAIQTVLGKEKVTLIFHSGSLIEDKKGLLEGTGQTRSYRITTDSLNKTALKSFVKQAAKISLSTKPA